MNRPPALRNWLGNVTWTPARFIEPGSEVVMGGVSFSFGEDMT